MAVGVDAEDVPAARGEVAQDGADVFLGGGDGERVDRLEEARGGVRDRLLERVVAGDLEGDVLRVHRVHLAAVEIDVHVDDPEAGEDALQGDRAHALLDRGHEHPVDVVADQRLGEDQAAVPRPGGDPHPHLGELAGPARLLLVAVARFGPPADRLPIGDAGLLQFDRDGKSAGQPLDQHLQVDLALAGDDRLVDLVVHPGAEGGVLLLQHRQAHGELVLVPLRAQAQGDVDVGIGVFDLRQLDDEARAAERVARAGVAQLDDGAQVARAEAGHRQALAAVEQIELARGARSAAGPG